MVVLGKAFNSSAKSQRYGERYGVWVPAFAGTTCWVPRLDHRYSYPAISGCSPKSRLLYAELWAHDFPPNNKNVGGNHDKSIKFARPPDRSGIERYRSPQTFAQCNGACRNRDRRAPGAGPRLRP